MRQNPHVRICGGPGSATTLVYPTKGNGVGGGGRITAHYGAELLSSRGGVILRPTLPPRLPT